MQDVRTTWILALGAVTLIALAPVSCRAQTAEADAPVATASGHPAAPAETAASEIQTFEAGAVETQSTDVDPSKPHGYVEVGVGDHGYREVDGAVTVPLGKDGQEGQVSVAIGDVQGGGGRR